MAERRNRATDKQSTPLSVPSVIWCGAASIVLGVLMTLPVALPASAEASLDKATSIIEDAGETAKDYGFRAGSFLVAPVPFKNPMIGAGLALGGGYLFQLDEKSDNSYLALGALKSDNGTFGYGLSGFTAWNENRWKLSATLAEVDAFYDLFVAGNPVPINQDGVMISSTLLYGFSPTISIGGKLRYLETSVSLKAGGALPTDLLDDANLTLGNMGLVAQFDTRDDTFYPRQGVFADFELLGGVTLEGADRNYAKGFLNIGLYQSLGSGTVLASQLSTCGTSGQAPFYDTCALGGVDAFRGFSAAQHYDDYLLSLQVELRQKFGQRWGAVAFAGAGAVGDSISSVGNDGIHVAGGIGARFQLTKKFETDFALDIAYNDEDEETIYIYVGQRF